LHDSRILEDAQVARHAGLVNLHAGDKVVDRLLADEERLDDLEAARVREDLEKGSLHINAYAL